MLKKFLTVRRLPREARVNEREGKCGPGKMNAKSQRMAKAQSMRGYC